MQHSDSGEAPQPHPVGSWRELLSIAIPLIISTSSLTLMQVLDRIFLSWDSPDSVAACFPAALLHWTLMSPAFGTAMYVTTFVAQYSGAREHARIGSAVWQGGIFAAISGGLLIGLAPWAGRIFAGIGHGAEIEILEAKYFSWMCLGSLPTLLANVLSGYFAGRGLTRVVMYVNIAGALVNLVLDPLFIFGFGPIPAMSISGAALATVLAEVSMAVIYLWLIGTDPHAVENGIWTKRKFNAPLFLRLLRFGLPNGLHLLSDVTAFSVFVFLIGMFGKHELAATTVAFNLNMLSFMPILGMGMAVMTLVGNRIGEGRPELATRTTWIAVGISVVYMLLCGTLYVTIPDWFLSLYQNRNAPEELDQIRRITTVLLRFIAVYGLFDAMAIIFSFAIRGAGDTRFALVYSLVTGWSLMVLPTIWNLWYSGKPTLWFAWGACTLFIIVLGLGFFARFLQGRWKTMTVIEPGMVGHHDSGEAPPPAEPVQQSA